MAAEIHLGAILTAMVTPFDRDGARATRSAARGLARHLVEHGSDGVVVAGTTGESPTLDDDEKLRAARGRASTRWAGEATVVAGTGSNDTAHSVHLTREAAERGADAVLVVTPYYNKPNARGPASRTSRRGRGRGRHAGDALQHPGALRDQPRPRPAGRARARSTTSSRSSRPTPTSSRHGGSSRTRSWRCTRGTTTCCARSPRSAAPAASACRSHLVGRADEGDVRGRARAATPSAHAAIDAELEDVYETLFMTAAGDHEGGAQPARVRGRRRAPAARGGSTRRSAPSCAAHAGRLRPDRGREDWLAHCASCRSAGSARSART